MNEALHLELIARYDADQRALTALYAAADAHRAEFDDTQDPSEVPWPYAILEWQPEEAAPDLVITALAEVRSNTTFLREVIHEHGWPGRDLVGEDGADAAWLLLQHAGAGVSTIDSPENRALRHACVSLLEAAVRKGRAHPRHLAHTVDGINDVEGRSPVYAVLSSAYTVVDGTAVFQRDIDLTSIEGNRKSIGLCPLADDVRVRGEGKQPPVVGSERMEPWAPLRA